MTIEDTKKYFEGFPEAPASDSFKWTDAQGFEHMLTLRAWHVQPLMKAIGEAQVEIFAVGGKPAGQVLPAPAKIQERDEIGTPVVDGEGKPVMVDLPKNTRLFAVKGFYHGVTKSNKDVLKVVVEEKPYSGKYGHVVFDAPFAEWKAWPLAGDPPGLFSVKGFGHVVIVDPAEGEKYPTIGAFSE